MFSCMLSVQQDPIDLSGAETVAWTGVFTVRQLLQKLKQTNMELIKSVSERRRSGSTLPCHLHYLCWLFEYPALWGRHVLPGATFSLEASRCQAANFSSCGCVCTQQLFTWLNLTRPNQKLLLLKCLEGRGKLIGTDWRSALTDDAWSLFCWSCWM